MSEAAIAARTARWSIDRLGALIFAMGALGLFAPFVAFRANRIVPGTGQSLLAALPGWAGYGLVGLLIAAAGLMVVRLDARLRLALSLFVLLGLALALGLAAETLTPAGDRISRLSPAAGFWVELLAFGLLAADAVSRLQLRPVSRVGLLLLVAIVLGALLWTGVWRNVSVLREYSNRADSFWREATAHVTLALGSLGAAFVIGLPLGVLLHPTRRARAIVLNILNAIQTIPSIALFGLLIAPLAWVAANLPGAAALGIAGIGTAPALLALFLYALMPVVSNTLSGLDSVPASADEAARGMGMTDGERLLQVQLPLAFPSILAAIRIVLVQNIGLATIAALIGGGGFGVFVFQGVGQTAMDLVLLGAVPTIALAFASAVILDAVVETATVGGRS